MRYLALTLAILCAGCASLNVSDRSAVIPLDVIDKSVVGPLPGGAHVVATSQIVDPAGDTRLFPGRPIDLALSPDETVLAVKNRTNLVFIDMATKTIRQTLPIPKDGSGPCGIAWTRDGRRVWTTNSKEFLYCAERDATGSFAWSKENEIRLPGPIGLTGPKPKDGSAPGGFLLDEQGGIIYVALSRNNSVGVVNLAGKTIENEIPVGIAPYTIIARGTKAYVSNWGGRRPMHGDVTGPSSGSRVVVNPKTGVASTGTVSVVNLAARSAVKEIAVGLHPSGMALSPDGARLYVANANSDSISVIDTASDEVIQTFDTKPQPDLPFGSAPNAVTCSPDGATLYVANGGNNAIAVLDAARGEIRGFIPAGWYPGAVALTRDGATLCIANTKGVGSRDNTANPDRKKEMFGDDWHGFNSHDHTGSVSFVAAPGPDALEDYTVRVATNMRLPLLNKVMRLKSVKERVVPVPYRPGENSVFKHVLYIIKENRTYDQVFGDLPQGNGDPSLCQFGREVTPNHHALAEQFVLLDNFYCNGILSADGHQWANQGYVTDYIEKNFGGFPRSYPYEGEDAIAFASSGFIWDAVLKKGLTFRNYGKFVTAKIEPANATWTDLYRDYLTGENKVSVRATTLVHTLEPYICPTFIGFPSNVQDVYRAREFLKEFREFEKNGNLPNFMIMLLPNDHTVGTRPDYPTPKACVADNDLALGQIVDAISHSKFWSETAIFVVQDDPQAGLDHVDGRRTVALCVSPYTKRGFVDSTFYNQTGMLRTIELILGLPPLNQLVMASTPMLNCFTGKPDFTPYTVKPNQIPLDQLNPKLAALRGKQRHYAELSMKLPLDDIDQADEATFNRILWHSVKGYDTPYPKLPR